MSNGLSLRSAVASATEAVAAEREYAVLIPAFECASTIGGVVRGARVSGVRTVLVIDDGSTDGTAPAARAAGAEVVSLECNRGKGAALLFGLRYLSQRGYSHAVSLDGDGEHLPDQIPRLLDASRREPAALVLGCRRTLRRSAAINRFGNRVADLWVRLSAGRRLGDTQCGMRVYPIARMLALDPAGRRFEFETEVLIRSARAGIAIAEVPVRVDYRPPELRTSHYRKVRDTMRIIRICLRLGFAKSEKRRWVE